MSDSFVCSVCKSTFKFHKNLRAHMKRKHQGLPTPSLKEEVGPGLRTNSYLSCNESVAKFVCSVCKSTFKFHKNLRAHMKRKHPDLPSPSLKKEVSPGLRTHAYFSCNECVAKFTQPFLLYRHKRNKHALGKKENNFPSNKPDKTIKKSVTCSLCNNKLLHRKEYIVHLNVNHGIKTDLEVLDFPNYECFNLWKEKVEEETKSRFVKIRGSRKSLSHENTFYTCSRSGSFKPRGTGLRHLKTQGTCKINGTCPASINVNKFYDGKCQVSYQKTHVGHKAELGHLKLSGKDRTTIAAKISEEVPFQTILSEVQNSILRAENLNRLHLLTKKDLYNIKQSFNLAPEGVKPKSDRISVQTWVEESNDQESSGVFFFKPQGVINNEHSELKDGDSSLTIRNEAQANVLQNFGNNVVCVDGTHGHNQLSAVVNSVGSDNIETEPASDDEENDVSLPIVTYLAKTSNQVSNTNIGERKAKLLKYIEDLVSSVLTSDELDIIEKAVKPIKPTLDALKVTVANKKTIEEQINVKPGPSNKNIVQQQCSSTKKQRAPLRKGLEKSNNEEKHAIAL